MITKAKDKEKLCDLESERVREREKQQQHQQKHTQHNITQRVKLIERENIASDVKLQSEEKSDGV